MYKRQLLGSIEAEGLKVAVAEHGLGTATSEGERHGMEFRLKRGSEKLI